MFLDSLEYFTGILIFVTNHVGAFNEAIISRTHLSLFYPALDLETTLRFWKTTLDRLKDDKTLEIHWEKILDFARQHYQSEANRWNGRQIRNGIATALAIAREEAVRLNREVTELTSKHFEAVLHSSQQFTSYIQAAQSQPSDMGRTRSPSIRPDQIHDRMHDSWGTSQMPLQVTPERIVPDPVRPSSTEPSIVTTEYTYQSEEDDLEVEELEIKLQMAKLRRKQKALQAEKARRYQNRSSQRSETPISTVILRRDEF